MRRKPDGTCMTQAQYEAGLVIDRCVIALYDHGTRAGATPASVVRSLKADGFTQAEIAMATKRGKIGNPTSTSPPKM